jgi:hypothetical protein
MHDQRLALENRAENGVLFGNVRILVEEDFAGVGLRVDIDEQNLFAFAGKACGKRDTGGGFTRAAFLAGN